ncbi:class I histocompatibility antigen, F10 alpha chain-like [Engraulis encrasicolus]|uniref:class I histocompatibility antigen, F10 alpha chain-like n=1 Tax=Engraulis encrasicolus TaxID=184585 RepID=UPI002FD5EA47
MGPGTLFVVCAIVSTCLADVEPKRHSLYYVYTVLSQPVSAPGIFEFTAMGLLDDRKIDYYNSEDKVKIPEQDWIKRAVPADYWEKGTASRKSKEQWFKVNVNILMERMRHNSSDIHSLMWRHGCEAVKRPDGSLQFVKGVNEYSYDGRDFLSFDDDSMQWVAPVVEALQTKRKWDGLPNLNQYTKGYLEKECVEWLDKFQKYGDSKVTESQKQHPPQIHLFAKNGKPHGRYLLTCLATGFYPKDIKISISILKNDWPEKDGHPSDVLPNGDGTHQIRVTFIVEKDEIHMYRCLVNHRTLDNPIIVEWETVGEVLDEEASSYGGAIAVAVLLLIIAGVVVFFIGRKKGWFCAQGKKKRKEEEEKRSKYRASSSPATSTPATQPGDTAVSSGPPATSTPATQPGDTAASSGPPATSTPATQPGDTAASSGPPATSTLATQPGDTAASSGPPLTGVNIAQRHSGLQVATRASMLNGQAGVPLQRHRQLPDGRQEADGAHSGEVPRRTQHVHAAQAPQPTQVAGMHRGRQPTRERRQTDHHRPLARESAERQERLVGAILDSNARRMDSNARRMDSNARILDSNARLMDSYARRMDSYARMMDSNARMMDSYARLMDSNGRMMAMQWESLLQPAPAPREARAGQRGHLPRARPPR